MRRTRCAQWSSCTAGTRIRRCGTRRSPCCSRCPASARGGSPSSPSTTPPCPHTGRTTRTSTSASRRCSSPRPRPTGAAAVTGGCSPWGTRWAASPSATPPRTPSTEHLSPASWRAWSPSAPRTSAHPGVVPPWHGRCRPRPNPGPLGSPAPSPQPTPTPRPAWPRWPAAQPPAAPPRTCLRACRWPRSARRSTSNAPCSTSACSTDPLPACRCSATGSSPRTPPPATSVRAQPSSGNGGSGVSRKVTLMVREAEGWSTARRPTGRFGCCRPGPPASSTCVVPTHCTRATTSTWPTPRWPSRSASASPSPARSCATARLLLRSPFPGSGWPAGTWRPTGSGATSSSTRPSSRVAALNWQRGPQGRLASRWPLRRVCARWGRTARRLVGAVAGPRRRCAVAGLR